MPVLILQSQQSGLFVRASSSQKKYLKTLHVALETDQGKSKQKAQVLPVQAAGPTPRTVQPRADEGKRDERRVETAGSQPLRRAC